MSQESTCADDKAETMEDYTSLKDTSRREPPIDKQESLLLPRKMVEMEADVVKKGYMQVKRPPGQSKIRLKAWQRRYLVLRDTSEEKSARLELHESASSFCQTPKDVHTVDLNDVVHIGHYSDSKRYSSALVITPDGHSPVIIASENSGSVREWLVAIRCLAEKEQSRIISNKAEELLPAVSDRLATFPSRRHCSPFSTPNISRGLRGSRSSSVEPPSLFQDLFHGGSINNNSKSQTTFPVKLQKTCSSLQHKLCGDYVMIVRHDAIELQDEECGAYVYQWPLANVSKFKSEEAPDGGHMVTLQAGLHSNVGEGTFLFKTLYGAEIVHAVREAVHNLRMRKGSHDRQQVALLARQGSLMCSQSASSPNILLQGRRSVSPATSSDSSPCCCRARPVVPPPVPPRSQTPVTRNNSGTSYIDLPERDADLSPDESDTVEYAAIRHNSHSSDEETNKHDDSGFSESSDDTALPQRLPLALARPHSRSLPATPPRPPSTPPSAQTATQPKVAESHSSPPTTLVCDVKEKDVSPPATLPRARKRRTYRPPPAPPSPQQHQLVSQHVIQEEAKENEMATPPGPGQGEDTAGEETSVPSPCQQQRRTAQDVEESKENVEQPPDEHDAENRPIGYLEPEFSSQQPGHHLHNEQRTPEEVTGSKLSEASD